MSSLFLSRIDTTKIYPPFLAIVEEGLNQLAKEGTPFYAISGYRDKKEQDALYAQGRTKSGPKVTNARYGQSLHNYGLAVDLCADKDATKAGLQPDWDLQSYEVMAKKMKSLGLDAAFYWSSFKEGPHIQLDIKSMGIELAYLKTLLEKGGLSAVWSFLDAKTKG